MCLVYGTMYHTYIYRTDHRDTDFHRPGLVLFNGVSMLHSKQVYMLMFKEPTSSHPYSCSESFTHSANTQYMHSFKGTPSRGGGGVVNVGD